VSVKSLRIRRIFLFIGLALVVLSLVLLFSAAQPVDGTLRLQETLPPIFLITPGAP
jgi:hypothetical protein